MVLEWRTATSRQPTSDKDRHSIIPEDSDHTSIQERITPHFNLEAAVHQQVDQRSLRRFELPLKPLARFEGNVTDQQQRGILFSTEDYIQLVDYTGRFIRPDKRGAMPSHFPPILERLDLNQKEWLEYSTKFEQLFYHRFGHRRQRRTDTG